MLELLTDYLVPILIAIAVVFFAFILRSELGEKIKKWVGVTASEDYGTDAVRVLEEKERLKGIENELNELNKKYNKAGIVHLIENTAPGDIKDEDLKLYSCQYDLHADYFGVWKKAKANKKLEKIIGNSQDYLNIVGEDDSKRTGKLSANGLIVTCGLFFGEAITFSIVLSGAIAAAFSDREQGYVALSIAVVIVIVAMGIAMRIAESSHTWALYRDARKKCDDAGKEVSFEQRKQPKGIEDNDADVNEKPYIRTINRLPGSPKDYEGPNKPKRIYFFCIVALAAILLLFRYSTTITDYIASSRDSVSETKIEERLNLYNEDSNDSNSPLRPSELEREKQISEWKIISDQKLAERAESFLANLFLVFLFCAIQYYAYTKFLQVCLVGKASPSARKILKCYHDLDAYYDKINQIKEKIDSDADTHFREMRKELEDKFKKGTEKKEQVHRCDFSEYINIKGDEKSAKDEKFSPPQEDA